MAKELTNAEWVRLAVGNMPDRPILYGTQVRDGLMIATDTHRLHVAPNPGLADGVWAKDGSPVEGSFPNWQQIMPEHKPSHALEVKGCLAVCAASIAYAKVREPRAQNRFAYAYITAKSGELVCFNATYLADALNGMFLQFSRNTREQICPATIASALKPALIGFPGGRRAVLMPVRMHTPSTATRFVARFCLDEFATAVVNGQEVAA